MAYLPHTINLSTDVRKRIESLCDEAVMYRDHEVEAVCRRALDGVTSAVYAAVDQILTADGQAETPVRSFSVLLADSGQPVELPWREYARVVVESICEGGETGRVSSSVGTVYVE